MVIPVSYGAVLHQVRTEIEAKRNAQRDQTAEQQRARRISVRNVRELGELVYQYTGFRIPARAICPGHVAPMTAFAEAFFGLHRMSVWWASRGFGGKSTLLALLGHMETIALGADVVILGGSGEQSRRILENQDSFWKYLNAPYDLLEGRTKTRTTLTNGGRTRAITASTRATRGPHPNRLRIDEADEIDLKIFDAAMGQTMSSHGIGSQTVMSSTYQYADGTMAEILRRASERGWPVRQWCYKECLKSNGGWLDDSEVAAKKADVPDYMWDNEYELQLPDPSAMAIDPGHVDKMFDPTLGMFDAPRQGDRERIIIEKPVPGAWYGIGGDWAKERDYTIIEVYRFDVSPYRLVAYARDRRRPWPVMVGQFNGFLADYPGVACHDNTGIGDVVDDYLTSEATGIQLVGKTRSDILSQYIAAIEDDAFIAPRIGYLYGEHKGATHAHIYGPKHLPDTICAGALALWAHRTQKRPHKAPRPRSSVKTSSFAGTNG